MKVNLGLSLAAILATVSSAYAGEIPLTEEFWETTGEGVVFETYKGQQALKLTSSSAEAKGLTFENGIIEYDVALPNARGFSFIQFRIEDGFNYEEFYLRPHQSGKPDANQYQPVINGHTHWQIYHGPEYSTQIDFPFDEWMHVKLVVKGDRMDVYLNGDEEPTLQVEKLLRDAKTGRLGIASFQMSRFANVSVEEMDNPPITELKPREKKKEPKPGLIRDWEISKEIFSEAKEAPYSIDSSGIEWKSADADENGHLIFSEAGRMEKGPSSIYARHTFTADKAGLKAFNFGYSDRVRVYVNGELTYSGDNTYRTRDFRYLGTIGLFDTIHVPAKSGENEIIFEVSESFGGWALMGQTAD